MFVRKVGDLHQGVFELHRGRSRSLYLRSCLRAFPHSGDVGAARLGDGGRTDGAPASFHSVTYSSSRFRKRCEILTVVISLIRMLQRNVRVKVIGSGWEWRL